MALFRLTPCFSVSGQISSKVRTSPAREITPYSHPTYCVTEVQIMRGINHPAVVKLLLFFESLEHYFLVLERMYRD